MTDLDVCRLSAEVLGKKVVTLTRGDEAGLPMTRDAIGLLVPWNSLTNAEQRWECVEWLLSNGCALRIGARTTHHLEISDLSQSDIWLECPASEFPARAVAELQKRKERP
jgi:hypothetical protein